jgi:hypothetical protein
MIGENRQLVTDGPVTFEKQPVEIQDCGKISDHFRGIYKTYTKSCDILIKLCSTNVVANLSFLP